MSELDKVAGNVAKLLDDCQQNAASIMVSEQYDTLKVEDFKELLKKIDQQETDGKGADITLKFDTAGLPMQFAILPANEHEAAKQVAQLLDESKGGEAQDLIEKVRDYIGKRNAREALSTDGDMRTWFKAVDNYEKDGIGQDITIDSKKNGLDAVIVTVNPKVEVPSLKLDVSEQSLDIPALTWGKASKST